MLGCETLAFAPYEDLSCRRAMGFDASKDSAILFRSTDETPLLFRRLPINLKSLRLSVSFRGLRRHP
jgi:hypothetical protein